MYVRCKLWYFEIAIGQFNDTPLKGEFERHVDINYHDLGYLTPDVQQGFHVDTNIKYGIYYPAQRYNSKIKQF